jgi:hypothetical protein
MSKNSIFVKLNFFLACLLLFVSTSAGKGYNNLSICVYFRYQEVQSTPNNMEQFANSWANLEKQVKVDKVYLETTRNRELATEAAVTTMKKFFESRGIKVSGGLGLTVNEANGFQSYCYSTQADRDRVKEMVQFTARNFDEIILDDFFFTNCTCDRCIEKKGDKSWTESRLQQMDEVSKNLIIGPAKAIKPNIHLIIKYPNWYESFPGAGYDLAVEPKLFDAIYTGTETRNSDSGQRLQPYQSYLQTQYFNNIKPGGNQGGWIDGGGNARYAEQFWNTFFAKVPEIMLFNSMQIMRGLGQGGRGGVAGGLGQQDPDATLAKLMDPIPQPDGSSYTPDMVARMAGYSAEILDRFLGKLGKPIGVATYKPCNSVGDKYLPNFLGMIGVPMDLVPEFPEKASTIFMTAASMYDKKLVEKTKKYVQAGGRAIVTTSLIEALGDKGFQGITQIEVTGQRVLAKRFRSGSGGFGRGGTGVQTPTAGQDLNILMPLIREAENTSGISINYNTDSFGYPMVMTASYGKGSFCILAIPDDYADLYRLPQSVLNQIRSLLGQDIFVSLDAPDHVSLFAYDNRTFIVQNYKSEPVSTRVTVKNAKRLRNLLTDQTIESSQSTGVVGGMAGMRGTRGGIGGVDSVSFDVPVPGNSFRVFQAE